MNISKVSTSQRAKPPFQYSLLARYLVATCVGLLVLCFLGRILTWRDLCLTCTIFICTVFVGGVAVVVAILTAASVHE